MINWDRKTGFCCRTCASYAPKTDEIGRCRRHAPSMSGYPVVDPESDWCGDHRIGSNPSKDSAYTIGINLDKIDMVVAAETICKDVIERMSEPKFNREEIT